MNRTLLWIFTIGIILIRAYWIYEEVTEYKERWSWNTVKTNTVEALILILQVLSALYFPWPYNSTFVTVGIIMYICGMILAIWAKITQGGSWGPPKSHDIHKQQKLITSGPFGFSRNPIYVSFTLIYIGYAIAIRSWLIVLRIPLLLYFYKSAFAEEKNLEKLFGEEYVKYKKRVPRFLFI